MFFKWLKQYMPRSLYGRAALILVLPVVLLQLVVSFGLIQRHFEGVTNQMTRAASREVNLVLESVAHRHEAPEVLEAILEGLDMQLSFPDRIDGNNERIWYDFSGRILTRVFVEQVPEIQVVQLGDSRRVRLFAQTATELVEIEFDRNRVSASNSHQLFVNMVFFGFLLTVVAYIYLRNQLRPITKLAVASEAFGRGRIIRYSPGGATEVRAAGNAFLDMRARIERQIEQRTLMLSGVSHDLRTPLTRFKLGLSLLEDEEREPLERDVEEMQRMLDAFLSFARSDSEGEASDVDPVEMVTQIVSDCARGGQQVTLVEATGDGQMPLRLVAMRRAIENLIGNAVRYGEKAEVSVTLTEKSLRIRVEDDGPGIAAENREEALKPFARLEPARNQNKGLGVGLGLSIAADVARAHGGVLRLGESASLGGLRADIVLAR